MRLIGFHFRARHGINLHGTFMVNDTGWRVMQNLQRLEHELRFGIVSGKTSAVIGALKSGDYTVLVSEAYMGPLHAVCARLGPLHPALGYGTLNGFCPLDTVARELNNLPLGMGADRGERATFLANLLVGDPHPKVPRWREAAAGGWVRDDGVTVELFGTNDHGVFYVFVPGNASCVQRVRFEDGAIAPSIEVLTHINEACPTLESVTEE